MGIRCKDFVKNFTSFIPIFCPETKHTTSDCQLRQKIRPPPPQGSVATTKLPKPRLVGFRIFRKSMGWQKTRFCLKIRGLRVRIPHVLRIGYGSSVSDSEGFPEGIEPKEPPGRCQRDEVKIMSRVSTDFSHPHQDSPTTVSFTAGKSRPHPIEDRPISKCRIPACLPRAIPQFLLRRFRNRDVRFVAPKDAQHQ